jgi:hypothetical protein
MRMVFVHVCKKMKLGLKLETKLIKHLMELVLLMGLLLVNNPI